MSWVKKVAFTAGALLFSASTLVAHGQDSTFITTNRDTLSQPDEMVYEDVDLSAYELIYEAKDLSYYYREDRDIIAIRDERNGYTWKTGIDAEFKGNVDDMCDEATTKEEKLEMCQPKEERLNTSYTGYANSLLTVEYYDEANSIKRVSSASDSNAKSELVPIDENTFSLNVSFSKPRLQIKMTVELSDDGISYSIKDEDISGEGENVLAAILITPFLGASGGQQLHYNAETDEYDIVKDKYNVPGYVLVPDGSGALIRFQDHTSELKGYSGSVYGEDFTQSEFYQREETKYVEMKEPTLPVMGIAHGNNQSAFVTFATKGDEYMEIVASPKGNMTEYTFAYPRYEFNTLYHQVYNKKGDGYYTTLEERRHFDIEVHYKFLEGDGEESPAANYFGMAQTYQNYLMENGTLEKTTTSETNAPVRVDFLMSDMKKGILWKSDVVMTSVNGVDTILSDLMNAGVTNINSGLLGYQKGGVTFSDPSTIEWNRKIGTESEFRELVTKFSEQNIDISLQNEHVTFSPNEISELNTSAKHANGWYLRYNLLSQELPETEFTYADPEVSTTWLTEQLEKLDSLGLTSLTYDELTNILLTDYDSDTLSATRTDAMHLIADTFETVAKQYKVNAVEPNQYLLKSVDRYLSAPVFSSQHLIETDTVPFLQIVLNGTMEVYAPYANFSFSGEEDLLRMIDYNVYPSFIITDEPSHLLSTTNSSNYYSTEYESYKEIITEFTDEMNNSLAVVQNATWTSRDILEPGVVVNSYDNGKKIVINYTEKTVIVDSENVAPKSYSVID